MTTPNDHQLTKLVTFCDNDTSRFVLQDLFGTQALSSDPTRPNTAEAFFLSYYRSRCEEFLLSSQNDVSVRTRDEINEISRMILSDTSRDDILSRIKEGGNMSVHDHTANTTLDFCASLLTMADVGYQDFRVSTRQHIAWKHGTLRQQLGTHFVDSEDDRTLAGRRIGKLFTARNISKIGGITIRLTDNLADHLRLADDDQTVFIFHHASLLRFHESLENPLLPVEVIREALRTLALLFPQNDPNTRKWMKAMCEKNAELDPGVAECGYLEAHQRQSKDFPVWQERLSILKQAFDDAQPQTLQQWFWDRRNRVQWYTFWIALSVFILTFFFGVIQCIEGAVQAYYAVVDHSNNSS